MGNTMSEMVTRMKQITKRLAQLEILNKTLKNKEELEPVWDEMSDLFKEKEALQFDWEDELNKI